MFFSATLLFSTTQPGHVTINFYGRAIRSYGPVGVEGSKVAQEMETSSL